MLGSLIQSHNHTSERRGIRIKKESPRMLEIFETEVGRGRINLRKVNFSVPLVERQMKEGSVNGAIYLVG